MRVGLDIGSTTIKCVVLDEQDTLLYSTYERHYSHILEKAQELLRRIDAEQLHGQKALLSISGSAGMGLVKETQKFFIMTVRTITLKSNKKMNLKNTEKAKNIVQILS